MDRKESECGMKIFISQPMSGKSPQEIRKVRDDVSESLREIYGERVEILDSWFGEEMKQRSPLYILGKSLQLLSEADLAVFAEGWETSRGCRIERLCCEEYGLRAEDQDEVSGKKGVLSLR